MISTVTVAMIATMASKVRTTVTVDLTTTMIYIENDNSRNSSSDNYSDIESDNIWQ